MKSFIVFPFEFDTALFPQKPSPKSSGRLLAHYELFKKIKNIEGAIIKCGISAEEGFTRFAMFRDMVSNPEKQKMIAFQKSSSCFEEEVSHDGEIILKVKTRNAPVSVDNIITTLIEKGQSQNIDFVPGSVCDTIPEYLIQNPELKISMLNIDLDEYESTMTALQFFYPRLVPGGILIIDNYFKNLDERKAIDNYFAPGSFHIKSFLVNKGPHYIVKS